MKRVAELAANSADALMFADPSFARDVVGWQKQHGRHALPWQNTSDPYRIWLSEVMLQQTQVAAVIPYYERFLRRFPDVAVLAAAPSEDVMAHWSGLGYYSRARNLHRCAQRICAEYGGIFPADPQLLADLPGIGRSTAAAISAFSYGTRAAILDGNVKRVFCRVFGVEGYPGERAVEDALWRRAEALLPAAGMEAYTQGLMDLGATLCTRSSPACQRCPLAGRCVALAAGRTAELPVRKPKKAIPEKHAAMLIIADRGQVLLEQRPDSGIWGGLLSLPEISGAGGPEALARDVLPIRSDIADAPDRDDSHDLLEIRIAHAAAPFGRVESIEKLLPFSHGFTHFRLHVSPYRIRLARRCTPVGQFAHVWYGIDQLHSAPLPAPVRKLLQALFAAPDLLPSHEHATN